MVLGLIRVFLVVFTFYVIRHFKRLKHLYLYNTQKEKIKIIYHPVLSKHIAYYTKLSEAGKERFIKRVYLFQKSKRFIGKEGVKITDELKCVVSASAVQLTFGLKHYFLPHFAVIILYPQPYFSRVLKMRLKGSASRNGVIAFSIVDYYDGYIDDMDNLNLGLHEMAHALELDNQYVKNPSLDFSNWRKLTYPEYSYIRQGNQNWLRKYAAQNAYEFFAVVIETFFESPMQMEKELPEVYYATCVLLNQDPACPNQDYVFTLQRKQDLKKKAFVTIQIKRATM